MPLYEFACEQCGEQSEQLVRAGAEARCPQCGSSQLNKLLPVVAAPARGGSTASGNDLPSGPCGSSCACFPDG